MTTLKVAFKKFHNPLEVFQIKLNLIEQLTLVH